MASCIMKENLLLTRRYPLPREITAHPLFLARYLPFYSVSLVRFSLEMPMLFMIYSTARCNERGNKCGSFNIR